MVFVLDDDEETIPMGNLQDDLALSGDEDDLEDEDQDLGILYSSNIR